MAGFNPITDFLLKRMLSQQGGQEAQPAQEPYNEPYSPPIGPTSSPLEAPPPPQPSPVQQFVQQRLQPPQAPQAPPPEDVQRYWTDTLGGPPSLAQQNPGPQEAPQEAPTPAQPPGQAQAAQGQPMPPGYGYFRQRYGWGDGSREALKAAQEEDRREAHRAAGGASGNIATTLVTGIPIDTSHNYANMGMATRHAIQRLGMEQDEPALQTAQAGADSAVAQSASMQAMMTPGHPAYRAIVAGALKEDPSLAEYGITLDSPAWMLGQVYAQRKPGAEIGKIGADTRLAGANAAKSIEEARVLQLDNDPRNPAIPMAIHALADVNPEMAKQAARTPGITMAQIAKLSGPALEVWKAKTDLAMKQQTYHLDVAKWNLEVIGKTGAPPGWQLARNPATGMPYRLLADSEKASIAEATAASKTVLKIITEMEGLVGERGLTGLGADEKMARYQTLAGQLKLYAPKLWGQENEKYGKGFESAMFDVLPTGKGNAWFIGESAEHVTDKLQQLRLMATQGMAVRMKAMGLEPSVNADPKSFQENRR